MLVGYALPVLPGQEARARNFAQELEAHGAAYEALNRAATIRRHSQLYQATPMGDLVVIIFDADDPTRIGRAFTDSAYDRWWLDFLRDVHGIDLRTMPAPPLPEPIFAWETG